MSKRSRASKAKKKQETKTNWPLIIGIIGVTVVAIGALLYFSNQEPETVSLTSYCDNNPERCVSYGEASAPATLIEVSDFGCGHCQNFHQQTMPLIKSQYVDNGDVRFVFLPYALRPETVPAAVAAMCSNEQGSYYEFSQAMFEQDLAVATSAAGISAAAENSGLDMDAFNICIADGRYNSTIVQNQQVAQAAGVSGTPTFFLNDVSFVGALPFSEFQSKIEAVLGS